MSLEEKIRNAKETDWITDGIPKWQVSLIVFFAKLKVKCRRLLHIDSWFNLKNGEYTNDNRRFN